jgi:glyoxylase-like metal-dependent hydrolase (beta-lactamase superfamily II)
LNRTDAGCRHSPMPLRIAFVAALWLSAASRIWAQPETMLLPENSVTRVSEHVYAILGFPNIGIVLGDRATLVVDTGLGARNGAIVLKQAEKLSKAPILYLTTTHFHPEHAMGEQAFPARTIIVRPAVQQEEMNQHANEMMDLFRGFSAQSKELLQDVKLRPPDILFDKEIRLDLGGVTARLMWLGPAHTRGDELIFVVQDSVLIPGDIVQDKIVPNMPGADASLKNWLAILDQLEPLQPRFVVPDHGALGDGSLISKERAFILDLQGRSLELKRQGKSAAEAAMIVTAEFKTKYPDWQSMGPVANFVKRVYAENP